MSQFRRRIQLVIDGRTVDVVTSARDFAAADVGDEVSGMENVLRLAHAACIRLHVDGIPTDWETFADLLDEFVDLDKKDSEHDAVSVNGAAVELEPDPIPATV